MAYNVLLLLTRNLEISNVPRCHTTTAIATAAIPSIVDVEVDDDDNDDDDDEDDDDDNDDDDDDDENNDDDDDRQVTKRHQQ